MEIEINRFAISRAPCDAWSNNEKRSLALRGKQKLEELVPQIQRLMKLDSLPKFVIDNCGGACYDTRRNIIRLDFRIFDLNQKLDTYITLNAVTKVTFLQSVLAHELQHYKQVKENRLSYHTHITDNITYVFWEGEKYISEDELNVFFKNDKISYNHIPWEYEANTVAAEISTLLNIADQNRITIAS